MLKIINNQIKIVHSNPSTIFRSTYCNNIYDPCVYIYIEKSIYSFYRCFPNVSKLSLLKYKGVCIIPCG